MTSFPLLHPDVLAFVCGFAFLWSAALAYRLRVTHDKTRTPWIWLAAFAATGGIAQWLGLITAHESDAAALQYAQLFLAASSFVGLLTFAREGVKRGGQPVLRSCVHALIPVIVVLFLLLTALGGLEEACRYGLALPAGLLGAAILYQTDRAEREGDWGLVLTAAALGFYAIGFAFTVPQLETFASLAAVCGLGRHYRRSFPLDANATPVKRWRALAAFLVLVVLGGTLLATRNTNTETVVAAVAVVDAGEAAANGDLLEPVDVDPRQAAREHAEAQRYKQGMSFLLVVLVIAVVWVGLSQLPGVKQ